MSSNYVTLDTLRGTGYALMAIATLITAVRLSPQLIHPKTFQWDDGFLLAAYIFFLVVAILYQVIANTMFRLQAVEEREIPPYDTMAEDGLFIQKVFFVVTSSLWFNLWCVKYSLLAFYKRLITGLKTYTVIWTVIVVFCFVVIFPFLMLLITLFLCYFVIGVLNAVMSDLISQFTGAGWSSHFIDAVLFKHESMVHSRSMQHSSRYQGSQHKLVVRLCSRCPHRSPR